MIKVYSVHTMTSEQQHESKKWLAQFMVDSLNEAKACREIKPYEVGDGIRGVWMSGTKVRFAPVKLVLRGTLRRRSVSSQWDPLDGWVELDAKSQALVDGLCAELEKVCSIDTKLFSERLARVCIGGPLELAKQADMCRRLADDIEELKPELAAYLRAQPAKPRPAPSYDEPVVLQVICDNSELYGYRAALSPAGSS